MAQTIVKEFTYAGSKVLVECANRDKEGNILSKTYAKKSESVRFDSGTLVDWTEGNIIVCNVKGQPEITCSDISLSQLSGDIGNIQNVINTLQSTLTNKLDTSIFNTYVNTTAPNEYVKKLNFKANYLDTNNVVYTNNLKTINDESLTGIGNIVIDKSSIGLSKVDNTSDADKPISAAVQKALSQKAPLSTVNATEAKATANQKDIAAIKPKLTEVETAATNAKTKADEAYALASGRTKAYSFADKAAMTTALKTADRTKYHVGDMLLIIATNEPDYWITKVLDGTPGTYGFYEITPLESDIDLTTYQTKVDNTLTTSQKTIVGAINAIAASSQDHQTDTGNPHSVTKTQVGLGNVVNTGDSAIPVSGGTTKFTTGGAFTELGKKLNKPSSSVGNATLPIYYDNNTSAFKTITDIALVNGSIQCKALSIGSTNVGPAITAFNAFKNNFSFADVTIDLK